MCSLMLFAMSLLQKGMETPESGFSRVTMMVFSLAFWFWNGFGLYVWVHARSFGSQPECNAATKLIVFGRELSATGSGRVVSLGE